MLKKIILISFLILFTSSYAYNDINEDHWAYSYIKELSDKGILSRYPDGTFKPERITTRAEFISILSQFISPKTDVSTDTWYWAEDKIKLLKEKNILRIDEYGEFDPDKEITRLEVCKMLVRALPEFQDNNLYDISLIDCFVDINNYSREEKAVISILYNLNILSGYPDNTLKLENLSTRAEISSLFIRFIENRNRYKSLIEKETVRYENDIAIIDIDYLPYELKKMKYSMDFDYITTQINNIDIFPFYKVPDNYKDVFSELYNGTDLYSQYRVKFGEGKYVLAINASTTNNTSSCDVFAGHEFLHVSFYDDNITIIDSFDTDEIKRQKANDASVGTKVMPSKTLDTSAFYIINKVPDTKIRINRSITGLYDFKLNKYTKDSCFTSLIINLKEGES